MALVRSGFNDQAAERWIGMGAGDDRVYVLAGSITDAVGSPNFLPRCRYLPGARAIMVFTTIKCWRLPAVYFRWSWRGLGHKV